MSVHLTSSWICLASIHEYLGITYSLAVPTLPLIQWFYFHFTVGKANKHIQTLHFFVLRLIGLIVFRFSIRVSLFMKRNRNVSLVKTIQQAVSIFTSLDHYLLLVNCIIRTVWWHNHEDKYIFKLREYSQTCSEIL